MKKLFVIGGPMGVGKTTVCQNLVKKVKDSVFLDGDWCWNSNIVTDETKRMVMDNICYLLNNYLHCTDYQTIVFCWVMHQQEILDTLLERLDTKDCEVKMISLVCDETTLIERLTGDIELGIRKEDVIARSLERLPLYQDLHSILLDTSQLTVDEVVTKILQL